MLRECSLIVVLLGLTYLSRASELQYRVPKYFMFYGDSYYYIQESSVNWYVARKSCEKMGFNLVSFETIEEFNAINKFMDQQGANITHWTSGTDLKILGQHAWFPSGKPVSWDFWYPGQPDNLNQEEHCDEFRYERTHKMNDAICTKKSFFVCELNLEPKLQIGY